MDYLNTADLASALDHVRDALRDVGTLEMIVCRPDEGVRRVLERGELSVEDGLVGDKWRTKSGASRAPDPEAQITVMNACYLGLIARERDRRALAGDQLCVDLDLSIEHLPAGSRLGIGAAEIEVSAQPHTGCSKFSSRFGGDALRLANSQIGRDLRLRGLNAKVIEPGIIRAGDTITKI